MSSLFKAIPGAASPQRVRITLDGEEKEVSADISVAAALLSSGVRTLKSSPAGGGERAPYCMMGVCFECLVEIDGMPGKQACLESVRSGMQIRRQCWPAQTETDKGGAT